MCCRGFWNLLILMMTLSSECKVGYGFVNIDLYSGLFLVVSIVLDVKV